MSVWKKINGKKDGEGDSSILALTLALGVTWDIAESTLALTAFMLGDDISSVDVLDSVLRENRFVPVNNLRGYSTSEKFVLDHPEGIYVIVTKKSVAAVIDGVLYDAINTEKEKPLRIWKK